MLEAQFRNDSIVNATNEWRMANRKWQQQKQQQQEQEQQQHEKRLTSTSSCSKCSAAIVVVIQAGDAACFLFATLATQSGIIIRSIDVVIIPIGFLVIM